MAKKKLSMSAKIRNLIDKGVEPQKIAKVLKITPAYVHTVKWAYANKGKKAKKAKKVALPVQLDLPEVPVASNGLDTFIKARLLGQLDAVIAARIDRALENMNA